MPLCCGASFFNLVMASLGFARLGFTMLLLLSSLGGGRGSASACFRPDLEALRSFAASFVVGSLDFEDWTGDDCCSWTGVTCYSPANNTSTARVSKLSMAFISSDNIKGGIPEAVCNLSALSTLELAESFLSMPIPECLGELSALRTLNLEGNNLNGSIPSSFSRLLNLQELYLYDNTALSGSLAPLSNLPNLTSLYLASNAFSGPLGPFNTPLLQILDASSNSLNSTLQDFALHSNLPSLTTLSLSDNSFSGSIPASISRLTNLRDLSLDNNLLAGTLPESLCQLTALDSLVVSSNAFTGTIPSQCQRLINLSSLDLSHNQLTGPFPPWIGHLPSLLDLILSFNLFSGSPPDEWQNLRNLTVLDLSSNSLPLANATVPARLPDWIFRSQTIEDLSLASMGLKPEDLECGGRLSMLNKTLRLLDLSNNNLSGAGTLQCLALHNFSSLRMLNLSRNPLSLFLPDAPLPPVLSSLDLSSCDLQGNLTDKFLEPVQNSMLSTLVLAENQLAGKIPRTLGNLSQLFHLDLSSNRFTGFDHFVNSSLQDLSDIYLSYNAITGDLASLLGVLSIIGLPELCSWKTLNLWTNMDLSHNNLTGVIPSALGQCAILTRVKLNDNNLVGQIPNELGSLTYLQTLTLSNNHFTGTIPASIANSTSLVVLDLSYNNLEGDLKVLFSFSYLQPMTSALRVLLLGNNRLSGSIPDSFGRSTPALQLIDLSHNNLTGTIPENLYLPAFHIVQAAASDSTSSLIAQRGKLYEELKLVVKGVQLTYAYLLEVVTSLDLSGNNLVGAIPSQLAELSGLRYLNLSCNKLSGSIPASLSKLSVLESLDLSLNKLEGFIPPDLSSLTDLANFNVSFNEALKGSIPGGPQFESNESYIGDPQLCGYPVLEACKLDAAAASSPPLNLNEAGGQEGAIIRWINKWVAIPGLCLGLVVGFGGTLWVRHGPWHLLTSGALRIRA